VFLDVWRQAQRFEARLGGHDLAIGHRPLQGADRTAAPARAAIGCGEHGCQRTRRNDPEATFAIKHRGEILRNCLTRLPPRHREIIDLVYYHEKSVQEAADILGVPGNTVKTRHVSTHEKKLSELLEAPPASWGALS